MTQELVNLLLLEDDADFAEAVTILLEKRSFKVSIARDVEKAFEIFMQGGIDAIVTDLNIRGAGGLELLRLVRQVNAHFPVIILTGHDSLQSAIESIRLGAQDYLLKSLDVIDDLINPVRRSVEVYRLKQKSRALEVDLAKSEALFRTVVEHTADIIYRFDFKDFKLDYVSPSAEKILGYSPGEIRAMDLSSLGSILHPDDRRKVSDMFFNWHMSGMGEPAFTTPEFRVCRKDGSFCWIEIKQSVVPGPGGESRLLVGSARDVSEWKAAAEREEKLRERMAHLEKMESLEMFAGSIAHDLNNMLMSMIGLPDVLVREVEKTGRIADVRQAHDDMVLVRDCANRAAVLVRNLLMFSRRQQYDMAVHNLNDVVGEYTGTAEFRNLAGNRPGVTVEKKLCARLPPVKCCKTNLMRVFSNICGNAFEVMAEGGRLRIETYAGKLAEQLPGYEPVPPGKYAVVSVADTGCGIGAENLKRIFEPYYSSKRQTEKSGTGLGLAIVWKTVKDHGGFINVLSKPGKGTEFRLYFPVAEQPAVADGASPDAIRGSERILVVDDSPGQLDMIKRLLESLGYRVVVAASGSKALEIMKGETGDDFDLVVLDMIMEHGFDGLDVFREMRKIRPGRKCIIISGGIESDRIVEARRLGVGGFIEKPFTMKTLGSAIRKELDGAAQVAEATA